MREAAEPGRSLSGRRQNSFSDAGLAAIREYLAACKKSIFIVKYPDEGE
jgi:hypothetical protein